MVLHERSVATPRVCTPCDAIRRGSFAGGDVDQVAGVQRSPRCRNGPPYIVRRPAITALPGWPGSGVPSTWPGPLRSCELREPSTDRLVQADSAEFRSWRPARRQGSRRRPAPSSMRVPRGTGVADRPGCGPARGRRGRARTPRMRRRPRRRYGCRVARRGRTRSDGRRPIWRFIAGSRCERRGAFVRIFLFFWFRFDDSCGRLIDSWLDDDVVLDLVDRVGRFDPSVAGAGCAGGRVGREIAGTHLLVVSVIDGPVDTPRRRPTGQREQGQQKYDRKRETVAGIRERYRDEFHVLRFHGLRDRYDVARRFRRWCRHDGGRRARSYSNRCCSRWNYP